VRGPARTTLGFTGKGVNVAVYEDGPDDTTDLAITARFITDPDTSGHARHTHGIIRNTEPGQPHGHARGCNLDSANSMDVRCRWRMHRFAGKRLGPAASVRRRYIPPRQDGRRTMRESLLEARWPSSR
jgi:hypothetical protein